MITAWAEQSRARLLELRDPGTGAWGYSQHRAPAAEPTALAALGLWVSRPQSRPVDPESHAAAEWLAKIQGSSGSVGISAEHPEPGWPTPYAIWLWKALDVHKPGRERAVAWLLKRTGKPIPKANKDVAGHDSTIPGWPWIDDTYGWVEPTALALLGLRAGGQFGHTRCQEGVRLLLDRALTQGGWNYGNTLAYGNTLRPQPESTGLALTALAGLVSENTSITRGLDYLQTTLPTTRAASSLAWGLIGLAAWGQTPATAETWLEEASTSCLPKPDSTRRLGLLLLASNIQRWTPLFQPGQTEDRHDAQD